jgi:hypothetical protein
VTERFENQRAHAQRPDAVFDDPILCAKDASTDQFAFTGRELACHALE